jgi:vacuolar iron transporter family protein
LHKPNIQQRFQYLPYLYQMEMHYINRSNWLRAAVLGANDGILSTASIAIGIAAASQGKEQIILATLAATVGGALSMAAGEYVSVSSQMDVEKADLDREQNELNTQPERELEELAQIYQARGVARHTAVEVAKQLTAHDALDAHARDELGMHELTQANPMQAALASGAAFSLGGAVPLLIAILSPVKYIVSLEYFSTILCLIILGVTAAKLGGTKAIPGVIRITFWGTMSMGLTAMVGYLFGQ